MLDGGRLDRAQNDSLPIVRVVERNIKLLVSPHSAIMGAVVNLGGFIR
jgi:hypothetical protein